MHPPAVGSATEQRSGNGAHLGRCDDGLVKIGGRSTVVGQCKRPRVLPKRKASDPSLRGFRELCPVVRVPTGHEREWRGKRAENAALLGALLSASRQRMSRTMLTALEEAEGHERLLRIMSADGLLIPKECNFGQPPFRKTNVQFLYLGETTTKSCCKKRKREATSASSATPPGGRSRRRIESVNRPARK